MTRPTKPPPPRRVKSVERRLFEAFVKGRGVRLSVGDVDSLMAPSEPLPLIAGNQAAREAGCTGPEWMGWIEDISEFTSWKEIVDFFKAEKEAQ